MRILLGLLAAIVLSSPLSAQPPEHFIANDGSTWTLKLVACGNFPMHKIWFLFPSRQCDWLGYTSPETKTILVLRDQRPKDERITVLHELMHVAVGVDLSNEDMTMHDAIYDISENLAPLLARNPALGKYFSEEQPKK